MSRELILLLSLVAAVSFIVVATTRWKLHPFLALLLAALGVGLGAGLDPAKTLAALSGGFGRTVGAIGIVIACGCIIGKALEKSGCAQVTAVWVLQLTGEKRAVLAMSGTGESLAAFAVALGMGLYATHCLVPPTPGPITAAGALGAGLGSVIGYGLLVAAPVVATTYLYARWIGRRIVIRPEPAAGAPAETGCAKIPAPGTVAAFSPIVLPVALIALKSWVDAPGRPLGDGAAKIVLSSLGEPALALILGGFAAWWPVRSWPAVALRSRRAIRQRTFPRPTGRPGHHRFHEPARQLLRQRPGRVRFLNPQN